MISPSLSTASRVPSFVVGAANAGKSAFIRRLLDRLEVKFPQGKVEQCASGGDGMGRWVDFSWEENDLI